VNTGLAFLIAPTFLARWSVAKQLEIQEIAGSWWSLDHGWSSPIALVTRSGCSGSNRRFEPEQASGRNSFTGRQTVSPGLRIMYLITIPPPATCCRE
jgi:hypothetical protein